VHSGLVLDSETARVHSGEAYFWTMANNMKEAEIERIKF
jgi:hypothetical protein